MMKSVVLVLLSTLLGFALGESNQGTVYYNKNTNSYSLTYGVLDKTGACYGYFDDTMNITGWGVLEVQSNYAFSDSVQSYACGYLEGALTYNEIYLHYLNEIPTLLQRPTVPENINQFLFDQYKWAKAQVNSTISNPSSYPSNVTDYWIHVGHYYDQLEGLIQGYNDYAPQGTQLSLTNFLVLNAAGDLSDIPAALNDTLQKSAMLNKNHQSEFIKHLTHCSALIKLKDDLSDIFVGHTTWFFYMGTNRIFKHIHLNLTNSATSSKSYSFSSYPGMLNSVDDYYVTGAGLVVMETSLNVYNVSLYYGNVIPQTLTCGARSVVANRMANSSQAWTEIFALNNGGTYNNQFMVLDTKRFTPGKGLKSNALWIIEQLPGVTHAGDVTDILSYGYWPSYNIPYFKDIFYTAGYAPYAKSDPDDNSYEGCARANIFRRDQGNIDSIEAMMYMMRYNDYQNDPLSKGNPAFAVASRYDLNETYPMPFGGYDSKVTSVSLLQSGLNTWAISGPTSVQQTPFTWKSPVFQNYPHLGLPDVYSFDFELMTPQF
eukprot:TRINITY_DN1964_c0_g2_i1.p1 TRINITY_DN1964_c0_g2~~TRINITY_DN1964_c0_g2_i1.p1  ORF type:complete len:544 (+),score=96.30 TRINITY_DN1964_c0_g2_i1:199-1830(+)